MSPESSCKELDLCGQICPSTLLTTLREVNNAKSELKSGAASLVVLTDNRSSTTHICEAVGAMGYHVQTSKEATFYRITISKIG